MADIQSAAAEIRRGKKEERKKEEEETTEVDLGPGHIVLDGDPAPSPRKGLSSPPLFGPCLLWPRSPMSATDELLLKLTVGLVSCFL